MKRIEKFVRNLLEKETGLMAYVGIFLVMLFFRGFAEQFLAVSKPITLFETIYEFIHNLYFFSIALILIWIILSLIFKIKPQKLAYLFTFSLFLIILPPLVDMLRNHGEVYWSFYLLSSPAELWKQYITVFGHLPSGIVYFGTKITFAISVLFCAGIIWAVTKNTLKTFLGAVLSYSVFFFMGSFPTIAYYVYSFFTGTKNLIDIRSFDIAAFFGAPKAIFGIHFPSLTYSMAYKLDFLYFLFLFFILIIFFFLADRKKFLAVVKNMRLPQTIYHFGLFFVGLGLGILQYSANFQLNFFSILAILVLLASVWLSWEASIIFNDISDLEIDRISNPNRPLPRGLYNREEYQHLGIFLFLLAILGGITIGLPFAVLLIIYQILAWAYSAPPYRLKKFPGIATFVSSLASLTILFLGYILMSSGQTIHTLSWRIVFLLVISYTISLPIKDFKDREGDKQYGIWTIPVLFGEKRARLIVAISVFISFILSVFFLNELGLFWWALLFGTLSFLSIASEKIKSSRLFWLVLGLVFFYGLILAKIVFLP